MPDPCARARPILPAAKGLAASGRGGRSMMSLAAGSASKTMEQAGSIRSSSNTICTGNRRIGQCSSAGSSASAMMGMCTANVNRVALIMLS